MSHPYNLLMGNQQELEKKLETLDKDIEKLEYNLLQAKGSRQTYQEKLDEIKAAIIKLTS